MNLSIIVFSIVFIINWKNDGTEAYEFDGQLDDVGTFDEPPLPTTHTSIHKTVVKHVQIPYPIDKIVKVDRHIPVPIKHYYHVNCPYEVIKYIKKPYIVKVERKVPVEIIKKIPVPQPVIKFESVIAKPQHINADELESSPHSHYHHHHYHHHHHRKHKRHNPHPFIEIEALHITRAKPIHIYGNQSPPHSHHSHQLRHFRRKIPNNHSDED